MAESRILIGDCIEQMKKLPDSSVHCCVTSPPYYGLRNYGMDGQVGLEDTPEAYVAKLVDVFREVRRVLRDDGTLWLNLGDTYAANRTYQVHQTKGHKDHTFEAGSKVPFGLKPKDMIGIPWRVAFALQADGWWLRNEIIWNKTAPMPESCQDRCTKAHEHIFLLAKARSYYFDNEAIREPVKPSSGRNVHIPNYSIEEGKRINAEGKNYEIIKGANKRDVWTVPPKSFAEAHFATYPPDLIRPCVLAGTSEQGCCAKCGAPWEREKERVQVTRERPNSLTKRSGEPGTGNFCPNDVAGTETIHYRWVPSCDCNAECVPCTILDPFFGAGTTGVVAMNHGRNAIGCELNPAYAAIAEKRIREECGLLALT